MTIFGKNVSSKLFLLFQQLLAGVVIPLLTGKAREDGLGLLLPVDILGSCQLCSLRCKEGIVGPDLFPCTFPLLKSDQLKT